MDKSVYFPGKNDTNDLNVIIQTGNSWQFDSSYQSSAILATILCQYQVLNKPDVLANCAFCTSSCSASCASDTKRCPKASKRGSLPWDMVAVS